MKLFKRFALALAAMLLFVSPAFADPPPWDDISELFTPEYVDEGDLGDESMSITALALAAGVSAAGAILVHKCRAKI